MESDTPASGSIGSTISSEARRLLIEGTLSDVLGSVGAVAVICAAEYAHADHLGLAVILDEGPHRSPAAAEVPHKG